MKRANYYTLLTLLITANLIAAAISYSQWTICGNLAGTNGRPTVAVVDENTAYVTGGTTVNATYKTTNGGTTWITLNTSTLNIFLSLWAKDANTIFAGSSGAITGTGILYKTSDGGTTWTVLDSITGGGFGGVKFSESMPSFGIAFSQVSTEVYVFKTRDGGSTWTRSSFPLFPGYDLSFSGYNVIDSTFYSMGTVTGSPAIINTTNGGLTYNLQNLNLPPSGGNFTRGVAFNNDKLTGIAGSYSFPNIARTSDGGLNWTTINLGGSAADYSPVMRWIEGTNTCYTTSPNASGGILKSTNGGLNWTQETTQGLGTFNFDLKRIGTKIYGYAVSYTTNQVLKVTDMVAGSDKRFFAHCISITPRQFTKGLTNASGNHSLFGQGEALGYPGMEFDNHGTLYCIAYAVNPELKTLDTTTGVLTSLGPITGITSPNQNQFSLVYSTANNTMYLNAFANGSGEIQSYLYTLNLKTRVATFIGVGNKNLWDIAINNSDQCYGISARNELVTVNLNTGEHTSMGFLDYNSSTFNQFLCFDRETNTLFIIAWNNDSMRSELRTINLTNATTTIISLFNPQVGRMIGFAMPFNTSVGIQNISSQVPDGYSLKQNYPNPFNPVTNLEFGISDWGFVSLKVYDVLGKEVATLVNTVLTPGTYKYDFDANNLSSGVYFYKLEADGFVDTKKMYLVK